MVRRICLLSTAYSFAHPLHQGVVACAKRVGPWRIDTHAVPTSQTVRWLRDWSYDGVIAALGIDSESAIAEIAHAGFPVVGAGAGLTNTPGVFLDEAAIGTMGGAHLIECGYRNLAYYGVNRDWNAGRYAGLQRFAAGHGISVVTNQHKGRWRRWESARDAGRIDDFLRSLSRPVGVMACDDMFARVLADAAVELGLRVPGDLAIIGVDNDELLCETGAVPLTSIDTNLEQLGFEAALMLDRLMRGEPTSSVVAVSPRGVVRRQSTSIYTMTDPDIAAALRYIHERACQDIDVPEVCRHVAISRRRLERRFHEIVGHSPGDEIRRVRMDRAKALLTDTSMTLAEISIRCGYSYISSFAAAFRAVVGTSPGEYRQGNGSAKHIQSQCAIPGV